MISHEIHKEAARIENKNIILSNEFSVKKIVGGHKVNDFLEIRQNVFKILLLFDEKHSQRRLEIHCNVNLIASFVTKFSHEF